MSSSSCISSTYTSRTKTSAQAHPHHAPRLWRPPEGGDWACHSQALLFQRHSWGPRTPGPLRTPPATDPLWARGLKLPRQPRSSHSPPTAMRRRSTRAARSHSRGCGKAAEPGRSIHPGRRAAHAASGWASESASGSPGGRSFCSSQPCHRPITGPQRPAAPVSRTSPPALPPLPAPRPAPALPCPPPRLPPPQLQPASQPAPHASHSLSRETACLSREQLRGPARAKVGGLLKKERRTRKKTFPQVPKS
jgi:hypothetical protein